MRSSSLTLQRIKDSKMAQAKGNVMVLNAESKKNLTLRKAALSYLPCSELLDGAKVMFFNPNASATLGK